MPHLFISSEDSTILREFLEAALVDLGREIAHTDRRDFRRALLDREKALERLLQEAKANEREVALEQGPRVQACR